MSRLTISLACTLVLAFGRGPDLAAQQIDRAQSPRLLELAEAGRDADLRGDWIGMLEAHRRLGRLSSADATEAWVQYYQGYLDWRQSALAYIGEGAAGTVALLRESLEHLERALEADPGMVEATALLALVETWSAFNIPQRSAELRKASLAHAAEAVAVAPANPRVRLMQVILSFSPTSPLSTQDSVLTEWRTVLAAFPDRRARDEPVWGAAEGWGLLGVLLLGTGRYEPAVGALDAALALRSDFWWVRVVALPQARQRPDRSR